MALTSVGDYAQNYVLQRRSAVLKTQTQTLSTELTTGMVQDQGARLRGDFVPVAGIEATLSRIQGYRAVTAEMGLFATSMQAALTTIEGMASDLTATLLSTSGSVTPMQVDVVGAQSWQKLDASLAALNTMVGDRSVFAGMRTNGPAVEGIDVLMDALEVATSSAVSAADFEAAVAAWFDDPAGFDTVMYQGGAALAAIPVAEGESARLDITALDPGIKDVLQALSLSAILDRDIFPDQPEVRAELVRLSGEGLLAAEPGLATVQARLGTVEEQIEAASVRNATEKATLEMARNDLLAADPYETASRLEEVQTQLETLFAITARMTRLSLVDFI